MNNLDAYQIAFVQRCVRDWMDICEENKRGYGPPDVSHSALLHRLLSGKKALPVPPPKSFSYPNYSLGEGLKTEIHDIVEMDMFDPPTVIEQHRGWKWLDKEKGLLLHIESNEVYHFWTEIKERKTFINHVEEMEQYEAKFLQKVEKGSYV